jgi:hypothetical protein
MKVYDNYEISPCRRYEEPDSPGKFYFEVSTPKEADVWTLYGHIDGEGVQAIGDFSTREHAEQVYSRITGLRFTGSYQADTRLRVMHAGSKLMEALLALKTANGAEDFNGWHPGFADAISKANAAIAEATGRAV